MFSKVLRLLDNNSDLTSLAFLNRGMFGDASLPGDFYLIRLFRKHCL